MSLCIKLLIVLLILCLILPINVHANEQSSEKQIKIEYQSNEGRLVYNTSGVPNQADEDARQIQIEQENQRQALAKYSAENYACSCVLWINQTYGTNFKTLDRYARSIPTNSTSPRLSGFVVLMESSLGHIAHYTLEGQNLVLDEANYETCKVTHGRTIPITDTRIKGYIQ